MPVRFDLLQIGQLYDRPTLAELWGYASHHALSRGVFTPRDSPYIILFVTHDKQQTLTQYHDELEEDLLFWEGEQGHGNDQRIIDAAQQVSTVHLFYRDRHHSPFIYHGPLQLVSYDLRSDKPSRFVFQVLARAMTVPEPPTDRIAEPSSVATPLTTERQALIDSRLGQGRFRQQLLQLWGGCAVTGAQNERVLRASHIKPWRASDNPERLDPYNGLLLVPNLDIVFDAGLVTFNREGWIMLSTDLSTADRQALHLDTQLRLRQIFLENERYLCYHRDQVFRG